MQIIPKANTLRKSVLLYRGIRYRRGYGVHSPFVFNLITKVIEERCSYYSFYDIELIRKQLLFRDNIITYPDRQQKGILRRPYGLRAAVRSERLWSAKRSSPSTEPCFSAWRTISSRKIYFNWDRRWGYPPFI